MLLFRDAGQESALERAGWAEANRSSRLEVQTEIVLCDVEWFSNVVLFLQERTLGRAVELKAEAVL